MKHLTATDFYRYIQCPHWPYWELYGDKTDRRPLTAEQEKRMADGLTHEREIVAEQFGEAFTVTTMQEDGAKETLELMRQGVPIIYQGTLMDGDWSGRPDILERINGKSKLGDWYYVPLDVKRSHELKKEHKASGEFWRTWESRPCSLTQPIVVSAFNAKVHWTCG